MSAASRYDGPERRSVRDNQSFRVPALVLIIAFIGALVGLSGWALDLERRKADRTAIEAMQSDINEIRRDVKELLKFGKR